MPFHDPPIEKDPIFISNYQNYLSGFYPKLPQQQPNTINTRIFGHQFVKPV